MSRKPISKNIPKVDGRKLPAHPHAMPEMKASTHSGIRTFECIIPVNKLLGGELDDWPANLQDGIYQAFENLSKSVQLPLAIVASRAGTDMDLPEEYPHRFYVHVLVSEIVASNEALIDPSSIVKKLPRFRQ